MTKQESSAWLEYESKRQGVTTDELREQMRQKGAKSDKSNVGFKDPEVARRAALKGVEARKRKREEAQNS